MNTETGVYWKHPNLHTVRWTQADVVLRLDFTLLCRHIRLLRFLFLFPSPQSPCTIRSGGFVLYDTIWRLLLILSVRYQSPSHTYYNT